MILTETNGGTRLSSTRYVHYGTISATRASFGFLSFFFSEKNADPNQCYAVKTGRWAGVVTAFITMSDIRDEIDWEFPGANTTTGQTNYYWQGVIRTRLSTTLHTEILHSFLANVTHGAIESGLTDTFSNYHEYTVRSLLLQRTIRPH